MAEILPELERRYAKYPDQLLQNVKGQFINFVKATSCYIQADQPEAIKAVWRGTDLPQMSVSIDFIQPPKLLTFYLEYQWYFDNINMGQTDKVILTSKPQPIDSDERPFRTRTQTIKMLPEEFWL